MKTLAIDSYKPIRDAVAQPCITNVTHSIYYTIPLYRYYRNLQKGRSLLEQTPRQFRVIESFEKTVSRRNFTGRKFSQKVAFNENEFDENFPLRIIISYYLLYLITAPQLLPHQKVHILIIHSSLLTYNPELTYISIHSYLEQSLHGIIKTLTKQLLKTIYQLYCNL